MALDWVSPLVVSVLRLVVIATLSLVNWAALWRLSSIGKCKKANNTTAAGRRAERLLSTSIIVVSLVYVMVVWAPFTLSALRHDLKDLQGHRAPGDLGVGRGGFQEVSQKVTRDVDSVVDEAREESEVDFTVEYIDLSSGRSYNSMDQAVARSSRGTENAGKYNKKTHNYLPNPRPPMPTSHAVAKTGLPSMTWGSDVQDLVTSTCAYSLAFIAVARLALLKRPSLQPRSAVGVGVGAGVVVGLPGAVTLVVRTLGGTQAHFAPHQPELTTSGYFLYSIICDVHITQSYVVSLFLEWAALFTILLLLLALVVGVAARTPASKAAANGEEDAPEGDEGGKETCEDGVAMVGVEAIARDVVLLVGALWAWPVKPTLVLVLYCVYGPHWTNVVCWLAHVVVAVPVVFIPLAIFLSSHSHRLKPLALTHSKKCGKEEEEEAERRSEKEVKRTDSLPSGGPAVVGVDASRRNGDTARDNLKFYLGTDILKFGRRSSGKAEDRKVILSTGWGPGSVSEV